MVTQTYIDWTATIETGGELIMENDVRVTVSVCGDGEVLIDQIELIKWGKTVRHVTGDHVWFTRPVDALVPFSDSDEPWLIALAGKAEETLLDDERFIEAALEAVGDYAVECAERRAEERYDMAREMERA